MASPEYNRAVTPDTSNGSGTTGFLPKGHATPGAHSTPPLAEILASADNSWDLQPRLGVIADDDSTRSFTGETVSWDAHVYFDSGSTAQALQLRLDTLARFPDLTVDPAIAAILSSAAAILPCECLPQDGAEELVSA